MNIKENEAFPEPFPYGDEFNSIDQLIEVVKERTARGLSAYGHAILYIGDERIPARVSFQGEVIVGAHCENI